MIDPRNGNFNLTALSPCIDAGSPTLPRDPDNTIADIGALYFEQPLIDIRLFPHNPPIYVPIGGGTFSFEAELENRTGAAVTIDIWTEVRLPRGSIISPVILRQNLTIPADSVFTRNVTQYVPGSAPNGNYNYIGSVGIYPDSVFNQDRFYFAKLYGYSESNHNLGWTAYCCCDCEKSQITNQQSQIVNIEVSPNPFNASTVARFEMRDASQVKLAIYDIVGREAAVLAEGFYPAGEHQAVWDASGMASGVYFARLQAGSAVRTQKLLLLK